MMDDRMLSGQGVFQDPQLGGREVTLAAGQVVYEAQTPATQVYSVQRGEVRLYVDGPAGSSRLVAIMGPGDWFGAAALAQHSTYGMRAAAVGPTTVIEAGAERFLIEWDTVSSVVAYDILAYSRPRHLLAKLGYPLVRRLQKRFAEDSMRALKG